MRHLAPLLVAVALATTVFGQQNKFDFGVEGGPSLSFLRGNEIIKELHQPAFGASAGLSFQYNFPRIFSVRTGIAFERKGSEINTTMLYTDINGNAIDSEKYHVALHFDYLTAPLLLRASFGKRITYFFNAGLFVAHLIKQTTVSDATQFSAAQTMDTTNHDKRFDTGVTAGLGLAVPIKNNFLLSCEVRNNLGLYNVSNVEVYNYGTIKTNSTNLLIGLAYKFGARRTEQKRLYD